MLNVYLIPKLPSLYQPSPQFFDRWLREICRSNLVSLPTHLNLGIVSSEEQLLEGYKDQELTPSIGIGQLFNQDAHDQLLPAELSFESMMICFSKFPNLIPLEEQEYLAICPSCEDQCEAELLQQAITKLDLIPLEQIKVFCYSCQSEYPLKKLVFEPLVGFARFWICFQQCGSTRLNHKLIKAWEHSLGCEFEQINVQRDELEGFSDADWSFSSTELELMTSNRNRYRQAKWSRKKQHKQKKNRTKRSGNKYRYTDWS